MRKDSNEQTFEFIRDKFELESAENQGWNDPGDMVFLSAMDTIATQGSKRRGSLLLPIIGIVSLLAVVTTVWFATNQSDITGVSVNDNNIATSKVELSNKQHLTAEVHEANKITAGVIANDNIKLSTESPSHIESPSHTANQSDSQSIAELAQSGASNNESLKANSNAIPVNTSVVSNPIKVRAGLPTDLNESKDLGLKNITREANSIAKLENEIVRYKHLTAVDKLTSLPISNFLNTTTPNTLVVLEQQVYVPTVINNERVLPAASIVLGFRNTFTTIKAVDSPYHVTLEGQNQYKHGLGFNIEFRKPISQKFSILASAGFDRISSQSVASSVLEFNENNIIGSTYVDDVVIHSPMGAFTQEMSFDIDSRSSDEINHTVWIDQSASLYNLSLGLSYNLLETDAILWDASISGGASYITEIQGTFFSEYQIGGEKVGDKDWFDSNNFRKAPVFASTSLNTSFTYKLTDKLGIQIGGGYQLGLTDVNKNIQNQVNSRSRIWTTQVGIRRTF